MNAPMNTMAPRTKQPKSYGDLDDKEADVNGQGCLQPILVAILLSIASLFLIAAIPKPEYFVWLDWDANPPEDAVSFYTLYIGAEPNPQAKIELGNQTSIQLLLNHPHTYAALTATNTVGESPRSDELHIINP